MTFEDLEARVASFTYKPGWSLVLYQSLTLGDIYLMIQFKTNDSHQPDRVTRIGMREYLPPIEFFQKMEVFDRWLLKTLDKVEQHETREWLKCDGVMIFDPHKGER